MTGPQTLQTFIEHSYLPYALAHKRPSTHRGYLNLYQAQIRSRIGGMKLASFRTVEGQRMLDGIAATTKLSHRSLIHIKAFLSGVFAFAKRMGAVDSNPMQGTEVPKGRESQPTWAYSQSEVEAMLNHLKGASRLAVIVAAYTGLSLGELQGLKWEDITEGELRVQRTIWHKLEGPPKTKARRDAVPLLPIVADALAEHHRQNPDTSWVFEGPYLRPLDMATLGSKRIKAALKGTGVEWNGWHALRRGFATRLHEAGVQDKIIQALMRHSSLSVTMAHYVKATPQANVEAMQKLNPEKRSRLKRDTERIRFEE